MTALDEMDTATRQAHVKAAMYDSTRDQGEPPAFPVGASSWRDPDGFRGAVILANLPNVARQFSEIPKRYRVQLDGGWCIECPCGRRPVVAGGELVSCSRSRAYVPTRASCGRVFVGGRTGVLVYSEQAR